MYKKTPSSVLLGAPPTWPGVRMASKLPPVCPQKLPKMDMTGGSGASNGRYNQLKRLLPYLKVESEDCLYLNLYVPRVGKKIFRLALISRKNLIMVRHPFTMKF